MYLWISWSFSAIRIRYFQNLEMRVGPPGPHHLRYATVENASVKVLSAESCTIFYWVWRISPWVNILKTDNPSLLSLSSVTRDIKWQDNIPFLPTMQISQMYGSRMKIRLVCIFFVSLPSGRGEGEMVNSVSCPRIFFNTVSPHTDYICPRIDKNEEH